MLIVETHPIYSVTATERSFVLGVIRLEKRAFTRMLASKATGHMLPAEIVVLVEDRLFEHYWAHTTAKSWARTDSLWREGHPGLYWDRYMTEDALRTWCKLAESLNMTLAAREGPHAKHLSSSNTVNDTPRNPYVVHLARAGRFSHGGMGLCQSEAVEKTPGDEESLRIVRLRSGICSTSANGARGLAYAAFVASKDGAHMEGSDRVERVLEVEGLEEQISGWDAEGVKKCATILGLEMVGRDDEDEDSKLRPRLRLVQSFASDRRE